MMKIKKTILCGLIAAIIALSCRCSEKPSSKVIDINWENILHSREQIDFCEIYSGFSSSSILINYSQSFTRGGGFKIIEAKFGSDSLSVNVLLESEKKAISHISSARNIIACIQNDFENRTLRTTLLLADDSTYSWTIKDTPIAGLRKIFFLKDRWIIEGSLNGTGSVFQSLDNGNIWTEVNLLAKGYKSFYLLTPLPLSNSIFCIGSTSYNEKGNKLLLFNAENGEIEEKISVESLSSYIKPISKRNLHAIVDGDKIKLYSSVNGELHFEKTIKSPSPDYKVMNLYVDGDLVIVTAEPIEIGARTVSWISYDQGGRWAPFHQDKELRLIYNSIGELFMVNSENYIARGHY